MRLVDELLAMWDKGVREEVGRWRCWGLDIESYLASFKVEINLINSHIGKFPLSNRRLYVS
jgi:hypothetical protein